MFTVCILYCQGDENWQQKQSMGTISQPYASTDGGKPPQHGANSGTPAS
jgi:hypothetical protein